jgi:TRAP-type mannitol/chloroaromatic compound transport system permease large subunit
LGASFFTLVLRGFDGQVWIEHLFGYLPKEILQNLPLCLLHVSKHWHPHRL